MPLYRIHTIHQGSDCLGQALAVKFRGAILTMAFAILPTEILYEIAKHLFIKDYIKFRISCRSTTRLNPTTAKFTLEAYNHSKAWLEWPSVLRNDPNHMRIQYSSPFDVRLDVTSVPSHQINKALELVTQYHQFHEIRLLLKNPSADPSTRQNALFCVVCMDGQTDLVQRLLKDERVNPSANNEKALALAIENDHKHIVKLLLADGRVDPSQRGENSIIGMACAVGSMDVVQWLLRYPRVNPGAHKSEALAFAAGEGHLEICRLLLADPRVDPSLVDNRALCYAAKGGYIQVMELLLRDRRVNALESRALGAAAIAGQVAVMRYLLYRVKVDPSLFNQDAFYQACKGGYMDAIGVLLMDKRVKPTQSALAMAAKRGHTTVVQLLLAHPSINPKRDAEEALLCASESDHLETVNLILEKAHIRSSTMALALSGALSVKAEAIAHAILDHPKMDMKKGRYMIRAAAKTGSQTILQRLLQDERIKTISQPNECPLVLAITPNHFDCVALLLHDGRVNPLQDDALAIKTAISRGYADIFALLLRQPSVHSFIQQKSCDWFGCFFNALLDDHESTFMEDCYRKQRFTIFKQLVQLNTFLIEHVEQLKTLAPRYPEWLDWLKREEFKSATWYPMLFH